LRGVHHGPGGCLVLQRIRLILASLVLSLAMVAGSSAPSSFLTAYLTPPVAFAQASACTLLGADGGGIASNLLVLNPANGAVSSIVGPIGFAVTGMAIDPNTGTLYGATTLQDPIAPGHLIRIDRTTGVGTVVGDLRPDNEGVADLTFRGDGTLFGWLEPSSDDLVTINTTTGRATIVGNSGLNTAGSGLAFSPTGTLFFAGARANDALRTVNPSTGLTSVVATLSGAPAATDRIVALAFDHSETLFGVAVEMAHPEPAFLVTINTSTGAISSRGRSINHLDAIVFDCGAGAAVNNPNNDDEEAVTRRRRTTRTNPTRGEDESRTEGNVIGVRCTESDPIPTLERGFIVEPDMLPYALIANRDEGAQKILLIKDAARLCQDVHVGDYLNAEGEKQSESLFYADDVSTQKTR